MSEDEWAACTQPVEMLAYLGNVTVRKGVLLCVACRRRLGTWDYYQESVVATDTAEKWADNEVDEAALVMAHNDVYNAREAAGRMILGDPDDPDPNNGTASYFAIEAAVALTEPPNPRRMIEKVVRACWETIHFGDLSPERMEAQAEQRTHAALLRDIFGNPFRPASFDPRWRSPDAVAIARRMYDERDFSAMPILADALMDAGCDDEDILTHCRSTCPHVRGCWLVDCLLGKE